MTQANAKTIYVMQTAACAATVVQNGEINAKMVATIVAALVGYKTGTLPAFLGRYSEEAKIRKPAEKRRMASRKYGTVVKPNSIYVENIAKNIPAANSNCGTKERERLRTHIRINSKNVTAPIMAPLSDIVRLRSTAVYSVKITLTEAASKNFKWKDSETVDLTVEFAILKADYDMSGVTFDDLTLTYDAEEHNLYIEGDLPYGVTVTYDGNGKKTPGRYTVTANFKGDELNHNLIPSKEATLEILEVSHDLSGILFEDMTVKYDGEAHDVLINGELPTNVTVTYEGNGQTDPSIYTVTAMFRDPDGVFAQMTATLTILRTQTQVEPSSEEKESDVFIESEEGFDPTLELVVEKIEGVERTYLAWGKDQVSEKFVVKMCKDGVEVQIDGKVTVRLLIPEEFRSKDFELMTVARSASVEYTRDGDYVIFVADGLSAYVFTSTYTSYFSVIIIATGVLFADVLILIALAVVLKKKKKLEDEVKYVGNQIFL